jgi:hypothetical protein
MQSDMINCMISEQIARNPIKRLRIVIHFNGVVVCVVAVVCAVIALFSFPRFIADAFMGLLGVYTYAVLGLVFFAGLMKAMERSFSVDRKYLIFGCVFILAFFTSLHIIFTRVALVDVSSFGGYLGYCLDDLTPGGVLFGVPAYIVHAIFHFDGSLIVLGGVVIVMSACIASRIVTTTGRNNVIRRRSQSIESCTEEVETEKQKKSEFCVKELDRQIEEKYQRILEKNSRKKHNEAKSALGLTAPSVAPEVRPIFDSPIPANEIEPIEQINSWSTDAANHLNQGLGIPDFLPNQRPAVASNDFGNANALNSALLGGSGSSNPYPSPFDNFAQSPAPSAPSPFGNFGQTDNLWGGSVADSPWRAPQQDSWSTASQSNYSATPDFSSSAVGGFSSISNFGQPNENHDDFVLGNDRLNRRLERARERAGNRASLDDRINARAAAAEQMKMDTEKAKAKIYKPKKYIKPTIDLIRTESTSLSEFHIDAQEKQALLNQKLQEFDVNARVSAFTVAPAVTRFEIHLAAGTRVNDVKKLEKDIALTMRSSNITFQDTIEGKNAIGIEVPNPKVGCVSIKDILTSPEFMHHKSPLAIAIGKNLNDEVVVGDISTMPHLLVAGSTGSGKSVCLNTMLTSLLFRAHPDDVKLLLVDMKKVELNMYNEIPHMLIPRSITEVQSVINALKWMDKEMQRRYDILMTSGVQNIGQYQSLPAYQSGILERMPYIIMVIDEAADLMSRGKREVEDVMKSLSALARASGIHIVLATQRPSVDVITSVIKTNFPTRIAFRVSSPGDSMTILNNSGAEKLVGRGDMLFSRDGNFSRVQGAYIEHDEARRVLNFIRENNEAEFDMELEDIILNGPPVDNDASSGFGDADGIRSRAQDPYFIPVVKWLVRDDNYQRTASISSMQRQFGIGFARAGKIIDQLTAAGFVGPPNGTKTRAVIASREEIENLYGE